MNGKQIENAVVIGVSSGDRFDDSRIGGKGLLREFSGAFIMEEMEMSCAVNIVCLLF